MFNGVSCAQLMCGYLKVWLFEIEFSLVPAASQFTKKIKMFLTSSTVLG